MENFNKELYEKWVCVYSKIREKAGETLTREFQEVTEQYQKYNTRVDIIKMIEEME